MTNYQLANEHLPIIERLVRARLCSTNLILYIAIYDFYYQLDGPKTDRYERTGVEFNMSAKNIQRIILKLNKES